MSTSALITMLLALVLVWGGFAAALSVAVVRTRQRRNDGGRRPGGGGRRPGGGGRRPT
jgi:hypothetical protein